jgi:DNA-binding NarL/FixJ family response regulator
MRDIRLLHLIAEGFADKEIASLLSTSVWTINRDVSEMLSRLDVMSRTEACVKAIRTGMIA